MNSNFRSINHLIAIIMMLAFVSCETDDEARPIKNELVAKAGSDKAITAGEEIDLDGSASFDGNDKPFSYAWSILLKPQGSNIELTGIKEPVATFRTDKEGIYVLQLKIEQGTWSATDDISITVSANGSTETEPVVITQDINFTTTWGDVFDDDSKIDYLITADIQVRAPLKIQPGVIIAFQQNTSLQILNGSLDARGSSAHPIIFQGKESSRGYWKGIVIYTNSDVNRLEFVTIRDGGSNPIDGISGKGNLILLGTDVTGASLNISNTTFENSGGYGLVVQGWSSFNGFSKNHFLNNRTAAKLPPGIINTIDAETTFEGNHFNGIETGGILESFDAVTWPKLPDGYHIASDLQIESGLSLTPGTTLHISPSTAVSVEGNGYLNAAGEHASQISFRSSLNGSSWNGLYINSASDLNQLRYAEISDAGSSKISGSDQPGNVVIGPRGKVIIENSVIRNSLGYGVVAKSISNVNSDVTTANIFENVQLGKFYPIIVSQPDQPELHGVWLDRWSFHQNATDIAGKFYDISTGVWFSGAATPWDMEGAAFGIRIDANGNFIWTIAEQGPMTGCGSFSAEYFSGTISLEPNMISFNQQRWRSKFVNPCDESWNVDMEVTPQVVTLPYAMTQMINVSTGETYWQLTLTAGDGSTFSFYRK